MGNTRSGASRNERYVVEYQREVVSGSWSEELARGDSRLRARIRHRNDVIAQNITSNGRRTLRESGRRPRIPPALGYTRFWESPFEKHPYTEPQIFPVIWPYGYWREVDDYQNDNPDNPESFPFFLALHLNRNLRFFMKIHGCSNGPKTLEAYPESQYLFRNLKYLRVKFLHHPLGGGIRLSIDEYHGTKRKREPKFRPMYTNTIVVDHINQTVLINGEDFQLIIQPPAPNQTPLDFPEGNGELPKVIGTYMRELDSCPNIVMEYKVFLYEWYNGRNKDVVSKATEENNEHSAGDGGNDEEPDEEETQNAADNDDFDQDVCDPAQELD